MNFLNSALSICCAVRIQQHQQKLHLSHLFIWSIWSVCRKKRKHLTVQELNQTSFEFLIRDPKFELRFYCVNEHKKITIYISLQNEVVETFYNFTVFLNGTFSLQFL